MRQVVSAEMGIGVDGCVDGTYQCGRQTTFLGGQQSCDCGAAGARHPINELRGDRARLALGEEQSSGSRHRLRGNLDGAVLGQAVLETGAGERINNLEIPGRRARGQGR